ncbi:MAG: Ldh family oxidoreductase, partial [Deltaproteobacteria bacterium]|nr:Ldh family oxidoreductase [Deltaproteobacteria bacterium]
RGRIRAIAENGGIIPDRWAVNAEGKPENDPTEALKGFVLPIGGHKGYGLAMVVDILSGVLTGSGFSTGVKSMLQQKDESQHVGHFFITIDPVRFMSMKEFDERITDLFNLMRSARLIDSEKPIIIPGEPDTALEKERKAHGVPINTGKLNKLKNLAAGNYDDEVSKY